MKIYTRGGDGGETTLIGGVRVPKDDQRVAAYGTIDELNALLGLCLSQDGRDGDEPRIVHPPEIWDLQKDLFTIGARLAANDPGRALRKGTIPELAADRIQSLEAWIDKMDAELPALEAFVLPGGSPLSAQLHVARTVCRRAERKVVGLLAEQPDLNDVIVPYLNRLSDLLFTLARYVNQRATYEDTLWLPQRHLPDETSS